MPTLHSFISVESTAFTRSWTWFGTFWTLIVVCNKFLFFLFSDTLWHGSDGMCRFYLLSWFCLSLPNPKRVARQRREKVGVISPWFCLPSCNERSVARLLWWKRWYCRTSELRPHMGVPKCGLNCEGIFFLRLICTWKSLRLLPVQKPKEVLHGFYGESCCCLPLSNQRECCAALVEKVAI